MSKELFRKSTVGSQHTVTNGAPNYERYEYLESVFHKNDLYKIFARPIILNRDTYGRPSEIRWMTDYDYIEEPVSLTRFSPEEQELLKGKIKYNIDLLYIDANKYMQTDPVYKDLSNILDNCIEIPNDGCIYIVKVSDEFDAVTEKFILTQWGFINDDRKYSTGIIKKWRGVETQTLYLKVIYPNGAVAAQTSIFVDHGALSQELITDENGLIELKGVPLNVSIHTYQLVDNEKENINNFNTDNRTSQYVLTIKRPVKKGDLTIIVKNHLNQVIPNISVALSYLNFNNSQSTDNDGTIVIKNILEKTLVDLSVLTDGKGIEKFSITFNPDSPVEIINLQSPLKKNSSLIIQMVDSDEKPLPNLPVNLSYGGKAYTLKTDENGKMFLPEIPYNTAIKVDTKSGKLFYEGTVIHTEGIETRILKLKKRNFWWLWLLLGLLLLLLLIWLLYPKDATYKIAVVDSLKQPITTAAISLSSKTNANKTADSFGRVEFADLTKNDALKITVSAAGYISNSFTDIARDKDTIIILHKTVTASPDTTPRNPIVLGSLIVHVIDGDTKYDLNNALVNLGNDGSDSTNGFGKAVFSNIATGRKITANVSLQDYLPATKEVICCNVENIVPLWPKVMVCGVDTVSSANKGITSTFVWDVGENTSEFMLEYNMFSIPDALEIFCGRDTTGKTIFTTNGPVSNVKLTNTSKDIWIPKDFTVKNTCRSRYVTVRVIGDNRRDPKTGVFETQWGYKLFRCK